MKTATQKTLVKALNDSSVKNGIEEFKDKMKQARWSGSSYRSTVEAQDRRKLATRFSDDLMKPYQDTYRNQVPAVLLAMGDKDALKKVILKKLKLAENEQRLARYLLEAESMGLKWLMHKWKTFSEDMSEDEVEHYSKWIETFVHGNDGQKDLFGNPSE